MVAGRFINVYATNDWTLGVAFRARYLSSFFCKLSSSISHANPTFLNFRSLLAQGLAGIQPVCIPGIEDVNLIFSPSVYIISVHVNLNDINNTLNFAGGCNWYGGRSLILLMENSANPWKTRTRQLLPCFSKHSLTKTQHCSWFIYLLFIVIFTT